MNNNTSFNELNVRIPSSDATVEIHGVLRGDWSQPLAILAPGLGGWMHDLILFNASRYFEKVGIATLRLSFYGHDEKQRDIGGFNVKTCAADIDSAVTYSKQQGSSWVCVVGHSYSGMAIPYSHDQNFDAAVLWDPSHTNGYDEPEAKSNLKRDFMYVEQLDAYVSAKGPGYVISRTVFEDFAPGSTVMANNFNVQTLIVNAQESGETMERFGYDYAAAIPAETTHKVIAGASHYFTENDALEQLYRQTCEWIQTRISL